MPLRQAQPDDFTYPEVAERYNALGLLGCDDLLPPGWSPCITLAGLKCNFYGTVHCPHGQKADTIKKVFAVQCRVLGGAWISEHLYAKPEDAKRKLQSLDSNSAWGHDWRIKEMEVR